MKRRVLLEKAAQLAAVLGPGVAAALAGTGAQRRKGPSDAEIFPAGVDPIKSELVQEMTWTNVSYTAGPPDLTLEDLERVYRQHHYALTMKFQAESWEDDLYGMFERAKDAADLAGVRKDEILMEPIFRGRD